MKKKLAIGLSALILILLFCMLFSMAGIYIYTKIFPIKGSENVVAETRDVSDFEEINIAISNINVEIIESDSNEISLEGEDNILSEIVTEVKGDSLIIKHRSKFPYLLGNHLKANDEIKIQIPSGQFSSIKVSNGSKISTVETQIKNEKLEINLVNNSYASLNIDVDELKLQLTDDASSTLFGKVEETNIDLNAESSLKALDLIIDTAEINMTNKASAEINVQDDLDLELSESAKLKYKGNPDKLKQQISGAAVVEKVN